MAEAAHERAPGNKERHTARKIALGLGATALMPVALLAGSAAYGEINEPHIQPSIVRMDSNEHCRQADFYVAFASGTGLQTAKYAARNNDELAETYRACRLVIDYGTHYDADYIASQLIEAIESIRPEGSLGEAHVMLVGASFGGIAVQEIANTEAIQSQNTVKIERLILESTPSSSMDVKGVSQAAFLVSKSPVIAGPVPVWVNGVMGAIAHGDNIFDPKTQEYINGNTSETSTRLIRQQVQKIESGYPAPKESVPTTLISSPGDVVVDYEKAKKAIGGIVDRALFKHYEIENTYVNGATNHADSWLHERWPLYATAYKEEFKAMSNQFKKPAKKSGTGAIIQKAA